MALVKTDDLMLEDDKKGTTAADAIAQVRTALKELVGPEGLDIVPFPTPAGAGDSSPVPPEKELFFKEADLHALARVPLSSARRKLTAGLDALRAAAAARESWEPGKADRLLRVKHDTVLKHRSMRASKASLAECRRLAVTADPFATPVALAIQRLRAVADETGATTTEDTVESEVPQSHGDAAPPTRRMDKLLTICNTKFLADFHFFDVASSEVKVKVKFRHLTAEDSEIGDDDVDESFADLIQKQDFDSLKTAFAKLMAQEELSRAVSKDVSLIDAFRCFGDDLLSAQQAEKKEGLSDEVRLCSGHGIIKRSALGLSIEFMKNHTALLGVEDAIPEREISVGRSQLTVREDMLTGAAPSSVHIDFGQTKLVSVKALYVLEFKNPIIVCLSVAQSLERVGRDDDPAKATDKSNSDQNLNQMPFSAPSDSRSDENSSKKQHWPSLQTLLAPAVFASLEQAEFEETGKDGKMDTFRTPSKKVVKKREHWSQHSTEFIATTALPDNMFLEFSHSGSDTVPGLAVHRVPLSHPKCVKPIFSLIRQQVLFNELFKSCFAKPIYPDKARTSFLRQPVEVVLCDAPSFMSLNFYDIDIDDILSVGITVELGGEVNVSLKLSSEQHHPCSDAKASAIMRTSRSIPITLMTVVRLGQEANANRS